MSDGYFSDVVVMLEELTTEQTNQVVERLKAAGLEVSRVDDDMSVVEGTIDAARAHDLKHIENVRYVRSVFTYLADYPPGDPRDRDGQ
jgi:septation ring formation regulator EzrA